MKRDTFSGFSSSMCVFFFWYLFGFFSTFYFRIVTYLEFNAVRYPCHLSLLVMLYIFQVLNRNVFSFYACFFNVVTLASLNINFKS